MRNTNKKEPQKTQEQQISDPNAANRSPLQKILSHINIHVVLVAVFLAVIAIFVYKIVNWGKFIDLDEIFKDGPGEYVDNFDTILPLTDEKGMPVYPENADGKTTIVFFGNAPFADDRDSENNLTNIIADMTGATVYNCSVAGSYLASLPYDDFDAEPINVFNFYWLCHLAAGNLVNQNYLKAIETLGDEAPAEAQEVYNTIKSIDFSNVDIITVMYDASDYLAGHPVYNGENYTDVNFYTGNLEAGLQLLKEFYPHIRIIVLSPTYAYSDQLDENGNYISSELQFYGEVGSGLYNYVLSQCISCNRNSVTFVDLYSTITGVNANQYLTDYLHLNVEGRKKVAERFIYALNYYNKDK